MKRLHINLAVESVERSVEFYSNLFATAPTVVKEDYAKSEKTWIFDPEGIAWETFYTTGESPVYL